MAEEERPHRGDKPRYAPASGSRRPRPSRDGDKPYAKRDGDKRPYAKRDGDKPYAERDGDKRPYAKRDGDKPYAERDDKPYAKRDGEKRPYAKRDGDKPHAKRDGEKRPYAKRDGDKPYAKRDGDKRPYERRDGDKRPYERRDGDKRPFERRDGDKPYAKRDGDKRPYERRDGDRPYAKRDDRRPSRPPQDDDRRRERGPEIPDDVTGRDLNGQARNELKTLSKENAEEVARHLAMAARLIDDDPTLAHEHALAASRRAGRIAVVRETVAITAYATGDFALALRELRTYRRISGRDDQIALMVDSERGVGRADRALEVGRTVDRASLPVDVRVELAIAMSGARLDLGQTERALQELDIPELDPDRAFSWSPALFAARATVLEELGRLDEAERWQRRADIAAEALRAVDADLEEIEIDEIEELDIDEDLQDEAARADEGPVPADVDDPGPEADETDDEQPAAAEEQPAAQPEVDRD
ncbi:primosomal protein [Microbacterium sp. PA5]|uniref:primosomal protein n=1 Tax=Microbacterium sp. PA5 TaxID=3416654 RepID=UPI003CE9C6A1